MDCLITLRTLLGYSDNMNRTLLDAAGSLLPEQLDQSFDMGMGTLRKTLGHIYVGEAVWLERWKGRTETPWMKLDDEITPPMIAEQFEPLWLDRDAFLDGLSLQQLSARQTYRDSKGSLFAATLHEMILQGIVHSTHHRAQAVNMLRRVGGPIVEVDFMYSRRQPA